MLLIKNPSNNLLDSVNKIGDTDISGIADGTITGSITELNNALVNTVPFANNNDVGFKVVAFSKRTFTSTEAIDAIEEYISEAILKFGENLAFSGNIYVSDVTDGYICGNVWGNSDGTIKAACAFLCCMNGELFRYYKKYDQDAIIEEMHVFNNYIEYTSSGGFTVRKYDHGDLIATLTLTMDSPTAIESGIYEGNYYGQQEFDISDIPFIKRPTIHIDSSSQYGYPLLCHHKGSLNWDWSSLSVVTITNISATDRAVYIVLQGKWK